MVISFNCSGDIKLFRVGELTGEKRGGFELKCIMTILGSKMIVIGECRFLTDQNLPMIKVLNLLNSLFPFNNRCKVYIYFSISLGLI